jgi:hypothetical protein
LGGSNYFVRILSTLNRELLKPNSSVALHRHSHAVVDILPPEADSTAPWTMELMELGQSCGEHMAVCQNLVPLVNLKIAGKWMFIPLKMVLIGIDPYPYIFHHV